MGILIVVILMNLIFNYAHPFRTPNGALSGFQRSKGLHYTQLLKKSLFLLLVVTIIGIFFSGCTKKEDRVEKVRLGYLQNDLHQLAVFVSLEKGFFKDEGLEVEVAGIFKAGPEEMSAFAAGALDLGYVGLAPATTAVANRVAKVKVLAQVNKEGSAIVVGKDSPIENVPGLIGKTIAVPGHAQVQEFLLKKALVKYQMEAKKINIIVIKPPEMITSLSSGQIDAFIAWEPHVSRAITSNVGRILLTSHQIWEDHPCCVLVGDEKFISEHPQKVRGILKAHIRATEFINQHPQEAIEMGVRFTGMDKETVREALANIEFTYQPSIEGEIEYVDFLNKLGYIKVEDPISFTNSFMELIFLKEILKDSLGK